MTELTIINRRIDELRVANSRLENEIAENNAELEELDVAAKVIARLTGAGQPQKSVSAQNNDSQNKAKGTPKPDGLATMPELIRMALKLEKRPMEPREITDVIRRNWWPGVDGQKIGSIVWRLNNRKDIEKVEGTSKYRLPQSNETPGPKLAGEVPGVSLFEPDPEAQGPKARPGGGP